MIGVYDYTVVLTYLSLVSAASGIIISMSGQGHPYWGVFFLLLCGLFDAFDGKVARTKKDRTQLEQNFGIQIDSLSDLIAFGVLPACIGSAMLWNSPLLGQLPDNIPHPHASVIKICLSVVLVLYVLAAMIRLAYFNVTEEERQKTEGGVRKYYIGIPVTTAALVFPSVLVFQYIIPNDITPIYFIVTVLMAFAFLSKIKVPKPGLRGILCMVAIGVLECAALVLNIIFHS